MAVESELSLEIRQALAAVAQVESAIAAATSAVLRVDTTQTAGEITGAVDAADTQVVVEAVTTDIAPEVTGAVDAADAQVEVTAETGGVTGEVEQAVDSADTSVTVEGDTAPLRSSIDDTVASESPIKIPVDGDPGPLKEKIRDGLGEGEQQAPAAGSRTGGAFAAAFQRATQGALKNLPEIQIGANTTEVDTEIASIRDQLLRLSDQTIGVDLSSEEAAAELARLQESLDRLGAQVSEPSVRLDIAQASSQIASVTSQLGVMAGASSGVAGAVDKASDASGGLSDALDDVNLGLIAASGSGLRFRAIIQAISAAGLAAGLFQAAQAASDLEESASKATVVFGDGIGEIRAFGDAAATSVGLSESAALEATATFGNLFVALGTTKQAATDLAPDVVQLAADLASFNNLAVDETLERLRSGLVGEVEPLRQLGISFDAAAVEAKAMELGLVDANGAITEGAKLQARWALILEQSGTAQGDFARTSEGLANQQRILSAEFQNAVTALGQALLPALLEGVAVARTDLIPVFQQIGEDVLPAVAKAFVSLLPLAGSFAQVLVALSPVIVSVADAIASLPPELITMIGLFAAFRRIGGSDLFSGLVSGFKKLADPNVGPGGFATSLRASIGSMIAANAASVGLTSALALVGFALQQRAEDAAEFRRVVRTIQDALDEAATAGEPLADALAAAFEKLVDEGGSAAAVLADAGLSAAEFGEIAARGGDITQNLADELGVTKEAVEALATIFGDLDDQVQAAAEGQVRALKASGDLTDAQIEAAEAANTETLQLSDLELKSTDYVRVLEDLTGQQQEAAAAIGVTTDETGALVEATGPAAEAAAILALGLEQVKNAGGDVDTELTNLAIAAGNARVAEEDLQTVADRLGVSLEDLKVFVDTVTSAINEFADTSLGTIPSIGDLIGDLGDDFSPQALLDKLTVVTEGIADFSTNLESLAAFPRVQQIAAENGPLVAAALAQPVKDGNTQVLEELEAMAGAYDLTYAGLDDQLRNELGPQIADATGVTAQAATDAFGAGFNPEEPATIAIHGTTIAMANANAEVGQAGADLGAAGEDGFSQGMGGMPETAGGITDSAIAAMGARVLAAALVGGQLGTSTDDGFSQGLGGMPETAGGAADSANRTVTGRRPFAVIAGAQFGGGFTSGTGTGAAGMDDAASAAAAGAISVVRGLSGGAFSAGSSLGSAIGQGMQSGINNIAAAVASAAAALVSAAIARARSEAQTGSPSKLFAALGEDMAQGLVVGLEDGAADVADAAASLVDVAAAASTAEALRVDVRPFDTGGSVAPASVLVQGVPGMVVINVPRGTEPGEAAALGRAAGEGFWGFVQEQQVRATAWSQ